MTTSNLGVEGLQKKSCFHRCRTRRLCALMLQRCERWRRCGNYSLERASTQIACKRATKRAVGQHKVGPRLMTLCTFELDVWYRFWIVEACDFRNTKEKRLFCHSRSARMCMCLSHCLDYFYYFIWNSLKALPCVDLWCDMLKDWMSFGMSSEVVVDAGE